MTSLLVLAIVLLLIWGWSLVERERRAAFMESFIHVPLFAALSCIVMAAGLWIRGIV